MALNIVVCVKNTPTTVNVGVDAATGTVKSAGLQYAMNPFDEYAVEEAIRLKEKLAGTTVTALSVGPASSENVLREAIARGADAGVLVTGPEVEGATSFGVSYALSLAIKKLNAEKPVN